MDEAKQGGESRGVVVSNGSWMRAVGGRLQHLVTNGEALCGTRPPFVLHGAVLCTRCTRCTEIMGETGDE